MWKNRVGRAVHVESWWTVIVIAFLTGTVVYQRWQMTHRPRPQTALTVGKRIERVQLESLEGRPVKIDWSDGRPTILYAFAPTCPWCERNLDAVRALAKGTSPNYRFIGVSVTRNGLREYLDRVGLQFPVYVAGPAARLLGFRSTPGAYRFVPGGSSPEGLDRCLHRWDGGCD